MSQKSSLPQVIQSVSEALMPDIPQTGEQGAAGGQARLTWHHWLENPAAEITDA
jgi:hypothetical protein